MGEEVAPGIGGRYYRRAAFCEAVCQGIREWLSRKRCGPCEPKMFLRPSTCLRKQVGIRRKKTGARCSNSLRKLVLPSRSTGNWRRLQLCCAMAGDWHGLEWS